MRDALIKAVENALEERMSIYQNCKCPVPPEQREHRNRVGRQLLTLQGFYHVLTDKFYDPTNGGGAS